MAPHGLTRWVRRAGVPEQAALPRASWWRCLLGGGSRAGTRRRCLYCGHDGLAVQLGVEATRCPRCGGDFYSRPPRSYLEMEGFVDADEAGSPSRVRRFVGMLIRGWTTLALAWRGSRTFDPAGAEMINDAGIPPRIGRVHAPRSRRRRPSVNDEG